LNVPELRERARQMAESSTSRMASLKPEGVFGEIVDLEPNRLAFSVLSTNRGYAFKHTDFVADHYIYTQAASLALAVVNEDLVLVVSARARFRKPARVGDRLMAYAKVGTHKENKYVVSVRTRIANIEIFVGRFVLEVVEMRIGADQEANSAVSGER
jgi:hypothetical protein